MKIIAAPARPDAATAQARTPPLYAQQWRKALEDAQWQARQRTGSQGEREAQPRESGQAAGTETAGRKTLGPRFRGDDVAPNVPAMANTTSSSNGARTDALAATVAQIAERIAAPTTSARPSLVAMTPAQQEVPATGTASRVSETGQPVAASLYELPEWPDVVVHLSVQGSTISVGMRDRSLQKNDALDLYYRLRTQLRAAGLELTGLIVNGHNVAPADNVAGRIA